MAKSKIEIQDLGHPIFETHCHLDYLKRYPLEELLEKCQQSNVKKIMTIGVSPEHQDEIIKLAETIPNVYCSQGIHPHEADNFSSEVEQKLKANISHPKVLALGEIGLDYHYDYASHDTQIKVFETQLQIAIQTKKPVIVHTREADDDTLAILKNYEQDLSNLVLHSYTSKTQLAEYAIEQGYYIGFNGIITFKNAQNVRDILNIVPIENLVIETDSPFLAPTPHRGVENGPQLITFVAQVVAKEKNIDIEKLLKQLWKNSHNLFNLPICS